jgi:hypothetical protein
MGAGAGLVSNIQRSRNPVDEYNQLVELEESLASEGRTVTDKQITGMLGITIAQLRKMRCVETMPEEVQHGINTDLITVSNAYKLAKLPPSKQEALVQKLAEGERITETDIKDAKRVMRKEVEEKVIPLLEVEEIRSDIPTPDSISQALQIGYHDAFVDASALQTIAQFCYNLLDNPIHTLDSIFERSNE